MVHSYLKYAIKWIYFKTIFLAVRLPNCTACWSLYSICTWLKSIHGRKSEILHQKALCWKWDFQQAIHSCTECKFMVLQNLILTLVMQNRATRKVPKAVAKVKSFLFLLRILKSSVRPVMTASMPPIWWTKTESDMRLWNLYSLKVFSNGDGSFSQISIWRFQSVLYAADSGLVRSDPFRASTWWKWETGSCIYLWYKCCIILQNPIKKKVLKK